MRNLIIRNIPQDVLAAIEEEKDRAGSSMNRTIVELLRRGLGMPEGMPEAPPSLPARTEHRAEPKTPALVSKPVSEPALLLPPLALKLAPAAAPAPPTRPKRHSDDELSKDALLPVAIPQHPVRTIDKPFSSLGLSEPILRIVKRLGFEHPTPIQSEIIRLALAGQDLIGLAQTGSGKTAAFVIPARRADDARRRAFAASSSRPRARSRSRRRPSSTSSGRTTSSSRPASSAA